MPTNPRPSAGPKPTMRAAVAGTQLIATVLLCAALGVGIGLLVGAVALLGILGTFLGFGLGLYVVYRRFGDL